MEPDSRSEQANNQWHVLEGQLRECYGRVVYSHKTHEKCADILLTRLSRIKVSQIALSALAAGGFIAVIFGAGWEGAATGATVSTLLLILNAYTKDYDLGELAQKHRQAGADLWVAREKYLSLLTDLHIGDRPLADLRRERDELLQDLHQIYSAAPSTTSQAYRKAQEALKVREDMTFGDEELDAFLPTELRRTGTKPPDAATATHGT